MALALDAVFPQEIISAYATATAALGSITTNAPTNAVLLMTADASDGSIITELKAMARATSAANVLVLFGSKDGGTTKFPIRHVSAAADTVSITDPAVVIDFGFTIDNPHFLAAGESLYVGVTVADPASGWVFNARGRNM